jgi:hypothetical protein
MKLRRTLLATIILVATGQLQAQQDALSLDDFLPPVVGGAEVAVEGVVTDEGYIVAPNAQGGLAYAYEQLMGDTGNGIVEITVPSGYAVLSIATEDYRVYDNLNATLLSKRSAYARAYARAQKQMVANFTPTYNVCTTSISATLETRDAGTDENLTIIGTSVGEFCEESVSGALAGYVLYSVQDNDPDEKTVTVAIATSSKTREAAQRVGPAVIVADNPSKAWDALIAEVTANVVAPLGARMIVNPDSGEVTIVGFGSAIVRQNEDESVARRLRTAAERQAQTRANRALVGFMQGESVYWEGRFDEREFETSEQYEYVPVELNAPKTDMMGRLVAQMDTVLGTSSSTAIDSASVQPLERTRSGFLNVLQQSEDYRVVSSGQVPPGVRARSFVGQDGHWAFAISVYSASMTERAIAATRPEDAATFGDGAMRELPDAIHHDPVNPIGPSGRVTDESSL